jgi:hypothetical protein
MYNPEKPSNGYDVADFEALKRSNMMNQLVGNTFRFDNADDASVFFATPCEGLRTLTNW